MMNAFWPHIENQFRAAKVDDAALADMRLEVDRLVFQRVSKMMEGAPAIYAKYFTADELREMTAFYRTPIGIKAMRELPAVAGEVGAIVASQMPSFQAEATATLRAVLRKHGYLN
jgi:hypothetical protein